MRFILAAIIYAVALFFMAILVIVSSISGVVEIILDWLQEQIHKMHP